MSGLSEQAQVTLNSVTIEITNPEPDMAENNIEEEAAE